MLKKFDHTLFFQRMLSLKEPLYIYNCNMCRRNPTKGTRKKYNLGYIYRICKNIYTPSHWRKSIMRLLRSVDGARIPSYDPHPFG